MIETLNNLDTQLFLFLNSFHSPIFDEIMIFLSYNQIMMGALILGLIAHAILKFKKQAALVILFAVVAFGLSDSISSRIFKPGFERLRPCHQEELKEKVHLAGRNCWGGKFGFVSSHASNSFAIATFFFLMLKFKWYWLLFVHAGLVSYSRVYLAKHFPGDIFCGALLGILLGYLCYRICRWIQVKFLSVAPK